MQCGGRDDTSHEVEAELPHPVVMRQGPAGLQNLVAGAALELGVDLTGMLDALVVVREVEVDADARVVKLGDPAGDEGLSRETSRFVLRAYAAFDVLAKCQIVALKIIARLVGVPSLRQN